MKISIYTDGSHLDKLNNGRLGCGGVMIEDKSSGYGKLIDSFGTELTPSYMIKEYGSDKCSNPTAEMIGVLCALKKFNVPSNAKEIVIYADYIGVREWCNNKWKIKEPYIKKVKQQIDDIIGQKNLVGKIRFEWVKAHQKSINKDSYWNNYVDLLAKGKK